MNKESAMESFLFLNPFHTSLVIETILLTFRETQQQFLNHKMDHSLQ